MRDSFIEHMNLIAVAVALPGAAILLLGGHIIMGVVFIVLALANLVVWVRDHAQD